MFQMNLLFALKRHNQYLFRTFSVQNGAIAEAIRIWKSNFDKEFQGVEECPICYSIIHTANHSLPRLACKTCKHKFHSACLYKWFSTSHKSTCPLCQTPFWYLIYMSIRTKPELLHSFASALYSLSCGLSKELRVMNVLYNWVVESREAFVLL